MSRIDGVSVSGQDLEQSRASGLRIYLWHIPAIGRSARANNKFARKASRLRARECCKDEANADEPAVTTTH